MASINQLVSEIAHAVGQPNNVPLRRNIKYAIIHTRNELIRKSYENHKYVDKGLQQRVRIDIIDVPDGDIFTNDILTLIKPIKRSANKVPRPVRLINNLPFLSIRTVGYDNVSIPFNKEGTAQFYRHMVGMCNIPSYDYINEYIYFYNKSDWFTNIGSVIVEGVFEYPQIIPIETNNGKYGNDFDKDSEEYYDDDEFLLPEDMIGSIKNIIFKRNLLDIPRETNETPKDNLLNK